MVGDVQLEWRVAESPITRRPRDVDEGRERCLRRGSFCEEEKEEKKKRGKKVESVGDRGNWRDFDGSGNEARERFVSSPAHCHSRERSSPEWRRAAGQSGTGRLCQPACGGALENRHDIALWPNRASLFQSLSSGTCDFPDRSRNSTALPCLRPAGLSTTSWHRESGSAV